MFKLEEMPWSESRGVIANFVIHMQGSHGGLRPVRALKRGFLRRDGS